MKVKVMMVDMGPDLLKRVKDTLEKEGWEVEVFQDLHNAATAVKKTPPNVLICEYSFERVGDGLDFLVNAPEETVTVLFTVDRAGLREGNSSCQVLVVDKLNVEGLQPIINAIKKAFPDSAQ